MKTTFVRSYIYDDDVPFEGNLHIILKVEWWCYEFSSNSFKQKRVLQLTPENDTHYNLVYIALTSLYYDMSWKFVRVGDVVF